MINILLYNYIYYYSMLKKKIHEHFLGFMILFNNIYIALSYNLLKLLLSNDLSNIYCHLMLRGPFVFVQKLAYIFIVEKCGLMFT